MQIERAKFRHAPDLFRQHSESHDDKKICFQCFELLQEFRVLQFDRLEDRDPMLHRELLHGTLVDFLAAATRLVGYSDHTDDVVLPFQKSLQRSHREFRCAHIDNSCFLEYSCQHTLCLSPPILYAVKI